MTSFDSQVKMGLHRGASMNHWETRYDSQVKMGLHRGASMNHWVTSLDFLCSSLSLLFFFPCFCHFLGLFWSVLTGIRLPLENELKRVKQVKFSKNTANIAKYRQNDGYRRKRHRE